MTTYRPSQLRPIRDCIVVQVDDLPEFFAGTCIARPDGTYGDTTIGMATVLATGPGVWTRKGFRKPTGVVVGERVEIYRVHEKVQTQRGIQALFGKGIPVLKPDDLLDVREEENVA